MWLASYLVHLRKTDWQAGASWMYRHLLDGDLASNTLSWQWVAGTLTGKPYLFNAENVERYAPQWSSRGTALDQDYDALDDFARYGGDCGPQSLRAEMVDEPLAGATPDPEKGPMRHADGEVWLMHPWALGEPPPGRVIGWIEPGFHQRFAWSEARWQFVLGRLRTACEGFVVGDATVLRQRFGNARLVTMQTYNPGYGQSIAAAGVVAEPVPRRFDDPPSAMPSFSRFWQRVVPKA
jgi:deoxyribodipyrimidine photo-lyase